MRTMKAFVMGAGTAFFLDPRQGRRRRHEARDRALKLVRRTSRLGSRKLRFAESRARGVVAHAQHVVDPNEVVDDDATVVQRIRSDAFRVAGVSTREVDLEVEDGVAVLHGSVATDEQAEILVARVADTPGVQDVAAMLRVSASAGAR